MSYSLKFLVMAALLVGLGQSPEAYAQLFGTTGLDPRFCDQSRFRQTVVYIDDMMMADGRTAWALKLADKLRSTLAPGERVSVIRLSPATGQSSELWSGCWPDYGDTERAKIGAQTYLFSKSPLAQLNEQRRFFLQGLDSALETIYAATKRSSQSARFSAKNPPTKQILRALASDEGRFANSKTTVRAIIYSDLAENSDLGSAYKPPSNSAPDYGQKLGSYLNRSVFYCFGNGEDVDDDPGFQESARAFWSAALRSMTATVGGIGADLNVPNTLPVKAYTYAITLSYTGGQLDGRLSILTNAEGDLVDSWIGVSRLTPGLLTGTFICKGEGDDVSCRLEASTFGVVTVVRANNESEVVSLAGSGKTGLKGHLGVKGQDTMFDLVAERTDR
jgi:hypothetical protein